MELTTYCFEKAGPSNTGQTLQIAFDRAKALGIRQAVVASSHGGTARKAHALMASEGIKIVAVTIGHSREDKGWCMSVEEKRALRALSIEVLTGVHALSGTVDAAFTTKHGGRAENEIVCDTLYRFCQGMKVAVECVLMAAEAGLLDMEQEVISIAGTDEGADTAIVCKPAYPRTFLDLEIREILAKPRMP